MKIDVNNGRREPIEGVARLASISVRDGIATVAVATAQLIRAPRHGQELQFQDERWSVIRTTARTAHVLTFTCRKIANG